MKVVVIYESLWGNTAAIAAAIGEGFGPEAKVLNTSQATAAEIADADLIVGGAPLLGFRLPTEQMRQNIAASPRKAPAAPDVSHLPMRAWLETLPRGHGCAAAFETRIWWSPGSAAAAILKGLQGAGYTPLAKAQRFIVLGAYGPLKEGERQRARQWGAELAVAMRARVLA